jgi:hypothetical protein
MAAPPVVLSDRAEPETPGPGRATERRAVAGFQCDVCGKRFEGQPESSGLLLWTRGEEVRYEEPPLCGDCAARITLGALSIFQTDEEEEG